MEDSQRQEGEGCMVIVPWMNSILRMVSYNGGVVCGGFLLFLSIIELHPLCRCAQILPILVPIYQVLRIGFRS